MLVEHKMVPLIIGSKGDTIQQITSESGAVIDVGKRSEPGGGDNKAPDGPLPSAPHTRLCPSGARE